MNSSVPQRLLTAMCVVFAIGCGSLFAAPLPQWDFESGAESWAGTDATVSVVQEGRNGGQCLRVAMLDNTTYDGAEVTITSAIPDFTVAFTAGTIIEFSAWVRVPDDSDQNVIIAAGLKPDGSQFTYIDSLRTTASTGIQREDGWVRMRCTVPAFRVAWNEYDHDGQSGATYTPTTLKLILRAQSIGQTFLIDDVSFRQMVPGELSDYTPPSSSAADDFLRPGVGNGGFRLLDGNGVDVILNGVNLWLYSDSLSESVTRIWNEMLYCFDEADMERLAVNYGMNVARLNLDYRWFEKSYNSTTEVSTFKDEGFAWLDRTIEWATRRGLYLILDLHAPPGGYQGPSGATASYFTTASLRKRTENFWVAVAQRYQHEPQIAAYDLINEPRPLHNADWYAEAERLTVAIRGAGGDSNHLVLVEAPFPTDSNGFEVLRINDPASRVMYDTHYYEPAPFNFNTNINSTYVSANTSLTDGVFGELSFVRNDNWQDTVVMELLPAPYGMTAEAAASLYSGQITLNDRSTGLPAQTGVNAAPVNVGEYGVKKAVFDRAPAAVLDYLTDFYQVLDHYGIHRQWWNYRSIDFGVHNTYMSFVSVPRLRNEALHNAFVALKSARVLMNKPEDRDTDGLADLWEKSHFASMATSDGSDDADADGDGFTDLQEQLAGTQPDQGDSRFNVIIEAVADGTFRLSWDAIPARLYQIDASNTLIGNDFITYASRRVSRKGRQEILLPSTAAQQEFFRVRIVE